jgi:hypothetical protein
MHILATVIFLGALALSIATIGWMLAANRAKIGSALLGQSGLAIAPSADSEGYVRRNQRLRVSQVRLLATPAVAQRLAA